MEEERVHRRGVPEIPVGAQLHAGVAHALGEAGAAEVVEALMAQGFAGLHKDVQHQAAVPVLDLGAEVADLAGRGVEALPVAQTVVPARMAARQARGAVDFETTETQIICDDNGRIDKIIGLLEEVPHEKRQTEFYNKRQDGPLGHILSAALCHTITSFLFR